MNETSMEQLDTLLGTAFDRALSGTDADLVATVMARIRRRQRLRVAVLMVVGTIAAVIAARAALPLLMSFDALLSGLSIPEWHPTLPVLMLVAAVCVFGGWLLLEEPA